MDVLYGRSQALFGVSIDVAPGTALAVLGPNGAGKSTFPRAVSGLVPPAAGRVTFDGRDITGLPAFRIRRLGLTYIPEGRGIFPGLSVIENLRMAVAQERRHERPEAIERAIEWFPVLGTRSSQHAGSMSGGEQQMLALARALAVSPKLVVADEMSRPRATRGRIGLSRSRRSSALRHHHRADRAVRASRTVDDGQLRDPDPGSSGMVGFRFRRKPRSH